MILILSNNFESSTSDVINWLEFQRTKWFRINENDKVSSLNLNIYNKETSNITILVKETNEIKLEDVDSYWYRRRYLKNGKVFNQFADNKILQTALASLAKQTCEEYI